MRPRIKEARRRVRAVLLVLAMLGPVAPAGAARPLDFAAHVPPGWRLHASATGDLDRDGRPDAALVLAGTDAALLRRNEHLGAPELDLNPRRLLVLRGTPAGYTTYTHSDRFLPSAGDADSTCLDDPLEEGGIAIRRGLLEVDLHYFLSCGGWGVTHRRFRFRAAAGRLRLIGLEQSTFARNSGEASTTSINYLSGRQRHTGGLNEFAPSRPRSRTSRLGPRPAWFLDQITSTCKDDDARVFDWCR